MNRFLPVLILLCIGQSLSAQYVYTIKADSVKITNNCDTAELILENHTQNVPGFLFNKGRGRTEFRRGAVKLNDSMYILGGDTMTIKSVSANNGLSNIPNIIQLGQDVGQAGSPAALLGDREIPTAGHNLSLSGGGSLLINATAPVGTEKLQVNNSISVLDNSDTSRFTITKTANAASIKFNSVTSTYNPTLTFIDNKGFIFGGNGQTSYLSSRSLINIYPKNTGDGYDPLINVQPFEADNMMRLLGGQNLSAGLSAGVGVSFQNNLNNYLQLYITGSGTGYGNGGPNTVSLWSNAARGIRLICQGTDSTAGIFFNTRGGYESYIKGYINNTGNWMLVSGTANSPDNGAKLQVVGNETVSGNVGIGGVTSITAKMHLGAGTATAGTAPLKLTAGTVLSSPEDGAIEYDGTNYYITQSTTRYTLTKTLSGQITTNFGGPSLSAFNSVTTTLSVPGAAVGDVVNVNANSGSVNPPSITITAFVTSANTVTLQAYNASNSAVTIASDTYKVRVIK